MNWERVGRIFVPDGSVPWMRTHASNPFALPIDDDVVRIYFSSRDDANRSSVCSLDYAIDERRIVRIGERPLLSAGAPGAFDDSGISVGWIVPDRERLLLYYMGWNLGAVPFRNRIGLAIGTNHGAFERFSLAPVLDLDEHDPLSLSYPCVLRRANDDWVMWYGSTTDWNPGGNAMRHVIKRATSGDGLLWQRSGEIAIGAHDEIDTAFSRPSVLFDSGSYSMWYSVRGKRYRIGCARSSDGVTWTRHDEECGLEPSGSGWDGNEVEYPHVFQHRGRLHMLYSGDEYGRGGFGMAVSDGT